MSSADTFRLLDDLRAIVGEAHVLTDDSDRAPHEWDQRRRLRGHALAVVRPADTGQVAAVVRACVAHRTTIVPQGGNTSHCLGATPLAQTPSIVLHLGRMHRIRALDRDNATLTADAGCTLAQVQSAADAAGLLFPLSLASEGSCTIGGNLGTNAGGTQVLRYGNARALCLGLEVVTPQGEIWDGLRGLRKDNTGYDLRHLMIGSEGTLGIITAATLQLFPQPVATRTAWLTLPSLEAAVQLLALAQRMLGASLTAFEVMGRFALELLQTHFPQPAVPLHAQGAPWSVLLEHTDQESDAHAQERLEALVESALQAGCVLDAVVATSDTQARQLWQLREHIPLAQSRSGLNIKHDIGLPTSRIPAFVAHMQALLAERIPGVRIVNFGHLGDGNLHFNVQAPEGVDPPAFRTQWEVQVNAWVHAAVAQFGGTFSAEHGVGALKLGEMAQWQSPVALGMMRAIKQALDPLHLMNPGKVLPPL